MPSNQAVYNYDQLGRLVNVTFSDGAMATYNYDAMGNRTTVVESAATTPSCCPPTVTAFSKRITGDFKNSAMMVLLSTGELIGWGDTTTGALANGIEDNTMSLAQRLVFDPTSTAPPSTATIVDWVWTNGNVYVVFSNGWAYSAGANDYGQLGKGDTTDRPYLSRIEYFVTNSIEVTKVWAPGGYGTTNGGGPVYFQSSTYAMYGCGLNTAGNLGNASTPTSNISTPAPCAGIAFTTHHVIDVAAVSNNANVSCYMLFNDGALYVAGYNGAGQLGLNTTTNQTGSFVSAMKTGSVAITDAASISVNVGASANTNGNALYISSSGTVWTCGYNSHGELGLGTTTEAHLFTQATALTSITKAKLGGGLYGYGYALKSTGALYTWGYNGKNNLFLNNSTTPQSTPSAVSSSNLPSGTISQVHFAKGNQGVSGGSAQLIVVMSNGALAYAGEDIGELGVPVSSGAYSLIPAPMFITDGTDSITDLFVHGTGATAQRWFILTELGNLYACGDNTDAICTGAVAGTTPALNATWSRISFVL